MSIENSDTKNNLKYQIEIKKNNDMMWYFLNF